jgi:hypothetical protein
MDLLLTVKDIVTVATHYADLGTGKSQFKFE